MTQPAPPPVPIVVAHVPGGRPAQLAAALRGLWGRFSAPIAGHQIVHYSLDPFGLVLSVTKSDGAEAHVLTHAKAATPLGALVIREAQTYEGPTGATLVLTVAGDVGEDVTRALVDLWDGTVWPTIADSLRPVARGRPR